MIDYMQPATPTMLYSPTMGQCPDRRSSQLLTPVSHFPSRMLPPPGTTPRILPGASPSGQQLLTGTRVEVRRFNMRTRQWMPWTTGVILAYRVERFHAGTEIELYDVEVTYPGVFVETYIPFLGELRDGNYFRPSDDAREMISKINEMKKVFACVNVPLANGQSKEAWFPAIVLSKRTDPNPWVNVLSGPLRGRNCPAPHILPYNTETAMAIAKTGRTIYWEKGMD